MTSKIIWSEFAETQLDEIYKYYEKEAGSRIAKKLLKGIINEPKKLIKTPHIGQEEELLKQRKIEYRYLVFKNYKLIYSVDTENGFLKIADVFDTRQNPPKLERTEYSKLPTLHKFYAQIELSTNQQTFNNNIATAEKSPIFTSHKPYTNSLYLMADLR